jgi:stearoyl-CoA desaturase (delta-9 desaturase)
MAATFEERAPDWSNIVFISAVHLVALLGFWTFSWRALGVALVIWGVTGGLGVTLGFHRLLTHQSFSAAPWLRRLLVVCGTLAVQGGPISWVASHRLHHAHSDRELDPHNSRKGFWWAHIGWMFYRDPKLATFEGYRHYAKDLVADPFILFLDRWFVVLQIVLGLVLLAAGGWAFVVWGIFVRLVVGWHCTWLVNSATHMWGYQSYDSRDEARNNWWVALITWGEGWHNNHHAFPRSARHGIRWWELDPSFIVLRGFEQLGWAWDLRVTEHLRQPRRVAA